MDNVQADAILKLQLGRLTRLDNNDIEVKVTNALKESAYQLRVMTEKSCGMSCYWRSFMDLLAGSEMNVVLY